jgi:trk system potassium uptake protein TrkA
MKTILVVGLGRFGKALVRTLAGEKVQVIAVSREASAVEQIKDLADHAVCADVRDRDVLESLTQDGIDIAVVAVSQHMDESVLSTMILKEMGVPKVVARAESEDHEKILLKVGADRVIEPTADSAERLGRSLATPSVQDFVFVGENFAVVECRVSRSMQDKTLQELELRRRFGVSVIAVMERPAEDSEAKGKMVMPGPKTRLQPNDTMLVIGRTKDLERFERGIED